MIVCLAKTADIIERVGKRERSTNTTGLTAIRFVREEETKTNTSVNTSQWHDFKSFQKRVHLEHELSLRKLHVYTTIYMYMVRVTK